MSFHTATHRTPYASPTLPMLSLPSYHSGSHNSLTLFSHTHPVTWICKFYYFHFIFTCVSIHRHCIIYVALCIIYVILLLYHYIIHIFSLSCVPVIELYIVKFYFVVQSGTIIKHAFSLEHYIIVDLFSGYCDDALHPQCVVSFNWL